jgi:hypothetical protein
MWAYDRSSFARSVLTAALLGAGVWTIIVVSDEAGSSFGMRSARLCALAPVLQILAVLWVLESARSRGEERALAALGVTPLRAAAAAVAGAWVVGLAASLWLASPWADPRSLFPVIGAEHAWSRAGASWVDAVSGTEVDALGGGLALHAPVTQHAAASQTRAALLLLLPLSLVAPLWAALRCAPKERWLVAVGSAMLVVSALHAAAARRVPELVLAGSASPLALHALWLARSQRALRTPQTGPRPGAR